MTGWPQGVGRRVVAEIDSTMAEAARIAATQSTRAPQWILALSQSSAKGRRGRPWVMPAGNFGASLLHYPSGGPAAAALRSFVAALALRDALIAVGTPAQALSLKWPNDVLLNGGKLAGILLESMSDTRGGVAYLVVGIGVNLAAHPSADAVEPGALAPVSLAAETGLHMTPEAFLDYLAPAFARYDAQLTTYGFGPIRTAWLSHAARLGQEITARLPNDVIIGTFRDIDADGTLILDTAQGRRPIAAAEISF